MKATQHLQDLGQSLWLDNITHDILHTDYMSTCATLASIGLPNDEEAIHDTR